MSKAKREAFVEGALYADPGLTSIPEGAEAEALRRYPDSPLGNVRECMVQLLKDSGYDGLYCPDSTCSCNPASIKICAVMPTCRPGVLVDGKIKEREG